MTLTSVEAEQSSDETKFLEQVKNLIETETDIGIAADFDGNITRVPPGSKGLDPREGYVDPEILKAYKKIRQAGVDIVIISSRGARDIARLVNLPSVTIIGSLGWETFIADEKKPSEGISMIHQQFVPFREQITNILQEIRTRFMKEQLNLNVIRPDEPTAAFETKPGERIFLQIKGNNDEYAEGINHTWSLSMDSDRDIHRKALERYYKEAFTKYSKGMELAEMEKLEKLCGLKLREGKSVSGDPTLDVEIRPISEQSKAKALIQLMREPGDPYRQNHFHREIPYHTHWIYSGDDRVQDGAVMRAGHLADSLTDHRRGILGVLTAHPTENQTVRGVDLGIGDVDANAHLHRKLADLFMQHKSLNTVSSNS